MAWDLFVSYKSDDADQVRRVVEELLANGVRVWFAEYQVLLSNYDQFEAAIEEGIRDSRHFLLFTSDAWARSPHCQGEVARIPPLPASRRVLEVRMRDGPAIRESREHVLPRDLPSIEWRGSTRDVLSLLELHTDIRLRRHRPGVVTPPSEGLPARIPLARFGVHLVPHPLLEEDRFWSLLEPGRWKCFAGGFAGRIEDIPVTLELDVFVGRGIIEQPVRDQAGEIDDRATYRAYMGYMELWCRDRACRPLGLHLVGGEGGPHPALTLQLPPAPEGETVVERRYAIRPPVNDSLEGTEVQLTFRAEIPSGSAIPPFETFCGLAPALDRIVSTLAMDAHEIERTRQAALGLPVLASMIAVGLAFHFSAAGPATRCAAVAVGAALGCDAGFTSAFRDPHDTGLYHATISTGFRRALEVLLRGATWLPIALAAAWLLFEGDGAALRWAILGGIAGLVGCIRLRQDNAIREGARESPGEPPLAELAPLRPLVPDVESMVRSLRRQEPFRGLPLGAPFGIALAVAGYLSGAGHPWLGLLVLGAGLSGSLVAGKLKHLLSFGEVGGLHRKFLATAAPDERLRLALRIQEAIRRFPLSVDPRFSASRCLQWALWLLARTPDSHGALALAAHASADLLGSLETAGGPSQDTFLRARARTLARSLAERAQRAQPAGGSTRNSGTKPA